MIILWCIVCALCTAWFAGDLLLGSVVAKQLFYFADQEGVGRAFAGLVFGDVLMRWVLFVALLCVFPVSGLLAAAAGRALKQQGIRSAILPLLAVMLLLSAHVATANLVKTGQDTAAALRARPDPVREEAFRTGFHVRTRIMFSAEMLAALGVAVGAAIAAHRAAKAQPWGPVMPPGRPKAVPQA